MSDEILEKLERMRAARAMKDEEAKLEGQRRELRMLEVEEQLETATGGRKGEAFALVDGGVEGPLGFRLGESVLHKRFNAQIDTKEGTKITPEACLMLLASCVIYPELEAFKQIAERRSGLLFECATAVLRLYGANEANERKK